jgi:hypothetical protein
VLVVSGAVARAVPLKLQPLAVDGLTELPQASAALIATGYGVPAVWLPTAGCCDRAAKAPGVKLSVPVDACTAVLCTVAVTVPLSPALVSVRVAETTPLPLVTPLGVERAPLGSDVVKSTVAPLIARPWLSLTVKLTGMPAWPASAVWDDGVDGLAAACAGAPMLWVIAAALERPSTLSAACRVQLPTSVDAV